MKGDETKERKHHRAQGWDTENKETKRQKESRRKAKRQG